MPNISDNTYSPEVKSEDDQSTETGLRNYSAVLEDARRMYGDNLHQAAFEKLGGTSETPEFLRQKFMVQVTDLIALMILTKSMTLPFKLTAPLWENFV